MKRITLLTLLCFSFNMHAQFIEAGAPSEFELKVNNLEDFDELLKLLSQSKKTKNNIERLITLEKIVEIKPNIPIFNYMLAEAYALNDDKTKAFDGLLSLQKKGLYYDIGNNENFANIKPFPVFDYIKDNFDANSSHFGIGTEAFSIDENNSALLFESIGYDSNSKAFLLGNLRDGSIVKAKTGEDFTLLVEPATGGLKGPWATIDMAIDEESDTLWVASSSISQFSKLTKESAGLAGIFKYKLSTGKLIKSFLLPKNKRPSYISSVHLTQQGDLYFIDNISNVVLKIAKDSDQISLVFSSKKYTDMRNITVDDTGSILYISDSEKGIVILDLKKNEFYTIENIDTLLLVGITDLIYDDNGLIMIQSSFSPERVMRLLLDEEKLKIKYVFPIESSHPLFNSVSSGVVVDEMLYYIANSQTSKTNKFGGLLQGEKWGKMSIISSEKHYQEQTTMKYKEKIDEMKKKTGIK